METPAGSSRGSGGEETTLAMGRKGDSTVKKKKMFRHVRKMFSAAKRSILQTPVRVKTPIETPGGVQTPMETQARSGHCGSGQKIMLPSTAPVKGHEVYSTVKKKKMFRSARKMFSAAKRNVFSSGEKR